MPPAKIKNIILDLGNTLVFFDYCYFFDGIALLEKKLNARKLKKYFTDNNFDILIGSGKLTIKDAFKILKKKFNLRIGYSDFYYLYSDIFWENTDMKNFLEKVLISSNYRLYMLSNVDASHIKFIDKNFPYVKNVKKRILSYKVKAVKPGNKIYKELIRKYKIDPDESIFIDDLKNNILAAKELGFKTIQYTTHKKFLKEFNNLVNL
ncbi:MAG TPA: HAD-IA family hydrolase [Ignavibacteria bacterium]|nr:HAD-IA family hydrolase [Ignavibacteria bacterium]HMR39973.1 HAD-IA family hydrolase [Ignavibacteria bacterium]